MLQIEEGDEVRIDTGEWGAYGRVAGVPEKVFTSFPPDYHKQVLVHIIEPVYGDVTVDSMKNCTVESIIVHDGIKVET